MSDRPETTAWEVVSKRTGDVWLVTDDPNHIDDWVTRDNFIMRPLERREVKTMFRTDEFSDQFGVVRLEHWPEGLVLWAGGEIRWCSWRGTDGR